MQNFELFSLQQELSNILQDSPALGDSNVLISNTCLPRDSWRGFCCYIGNHQCSKDALNGKRAMGPQADDRLSLASTKAPRPMPPHRSAAPIPQVQMRCTGCNRRLGDYVNEVKVGLVILEMKCPKCGQPHTEVLRGS